MADSSRDEIAKLEALYANNPEGRVFTHLAEALRRAGDLERARTILETGLVKHAAYASAHVVLGRVLMGLQQVEEGAEAFRRVLGLDPHNLVALRSLGDIARAAGRNAEALSYFEELRHQDPNNEEIGEIITELSASPSAFAPEISTEPSGQEELASRFDSEEAAEAVSALDPVQDAEPPIAAAAEPAEAYQHESAPEPIEAEAQHAIGEVTSDIDLDWVPTDEPESEDGLPGDLGSYAAYATAQQTPEVPTFGLPEDNQIDLGDGELAQAEEADAVYDEISFDPLPESEPEIVADAFDDVDLSAPVAEPEFVSEPDPSLDFLAPATDMPFDDEPVPGLSEPDLQADRSFEDAVSAEPSGFSAETFGFEPSFDEPVFQEPLFDEPAAEEPAAEEPAIDEPVFDEPLFDEPVFDEPVAAIAAEPAVNDEDAPEFVTETIAELYRSQGLHDRAAEVYVTLLQQRPGDPELEGKLREVEALARGETPAVAEVTPEPEAQVPGWEESLSRDGEPGFVAALEPVEAGEPEQPDPAEAWLAGAMGTADSGPSPYAWAESPAEANDGAPPITDYFRSLLSWKPAVRVQPAAAEAAPVESPVTFDEVELAAPAAVATYESEPEAVQADDIVFDELPVEHDDETVLLLDEPVAEPAPVAEMPASEPDPLPWEEPVEAAPVAQAAAPAVPAAPPAPFEPGVATNSEDAFDEWFGDPEPAAPAAAAAEPETQVAEGPGPEAGEGDDDDDLEMFRSWLQSLKK